MTDIYALFKSLATHWATEHRVCRERVRGRISFDKKITLIWKEEETTTRYSIYTLRSIQTEVKLAASALMRIRECCP